MYLSIIAALLATALLFVVSPVRAEEYVISGNGASSDSQISVSTTQTTNVTQSNEANIQNNVQLDANTGSNTASSNTGDNTQITSGDVNTQVSVENSVNNSTLFMECCPQAPTEISISGNGSDSTNSVYLNKDTNMEVDVSQNAIIENNIMGYASTGGNSADGNSGNVSITTGNIDVSLTLENKNINGLLVKFGQTSGNLNIKISGNGADSSSQIVVNLSQNQLLKINNTSLIINDIIWDLITGGNSANGNSGNVSITTGDIKVDSKITNGPINTSIVQVDCCFGVGDPSDPNDPPTGDPGDDAPPTTLPSNDKPTSSNSNPGPTSSSGGQVLAALAEGGQILPATGSLWMLILTLASLIMFFLGLYLRLHPGRDPNLGVITYA